MAMPIQLQETPPEIQDLTQGICHSLGAAYLKGQEEDECFTFINDFWHRLALQHPSIPSHLSSHIEGVLTVLSVEKTGKSFPYLLPIAKSRGCLRDVITSLSVHTWPQ